MSAERGRASALAIEAAICVAALLICTLTVLGVILRARERIDMCATRYMAALAAQSAAEELCAGNAGESAYYDGEWKIASRETASYAVNVQEICRAGLEQYEITVVGVDGQELCMLKVSRCAR